MSNCGATLAVGLMARWRRDLRYAEEAAAAALVGSDTSGRPFAMELAAALHHSRDVGPGTHAGLRAQKAAELKGGGRGRDAQRPTGTEDPASGDAAGAAARSSGAAEVRPHSARAPRWEPLSSRYSRSVALTEWTTPQPSSSSSRL